MRTSYSGNTLAFQAKAASSILAVRSNFVYADMAQLVERTLGKGEVGSSNLLMSSIKTSRVGSIKLRAACLLSDDRRVAVFLCICFGRKHCGYSKSGFIIYFQH